MSLNAVDGRILAEIKVQNIVLAPVLGAYELRIPLDISILPNTEQYEIQLLGARTTVNGNGGREEVGVVRPDFVEIYKTFDFVNRQTPTLICPMSSAQVSALEKVRDAGDLNWDLQFHFSITGGGQSNISQANEKFVSKQSAWIDELRRAKFTDSLLIEIPFPIHDVPDRLKTVRKCLEGAQRQFLNGEYTACVASLRTTVHELGHHQLGHAEWPKTIAGPIRKKPSREQTKADRETLILDSFRHYSHLAHHGPSEGGETAFSRAEAEIALQIAAALVRQRVYSM